MSETQKIEITPPEAMNSEASRREKIKEIKKIDKRLEEIKNEMANATNKLPNLDNSNSERQQQLSSTIQDTIDGFKREKERLLNKKNELVLQTAEPSGDLREIENADSNFISSVVKRQINNLTPGDIIFSKSGTKRLVLEVENDNVKFLRLDTEENFSEETVPKSKLKVENIRDIHSENEIQ
jgi:hypothetical protein